MRLIFLSTSSQLGGSEASLRDVLVSLRRAQPSWALALVAPAEGPLVTAVRAQGVSIDILPFPPALARFGERGAASAGTHAALRLARAALVVPGYLRRLRAVIRARRADLIHANGFKTHLLGAAAKPRGTALVWHMHEYLRQRPLSSMLLRRLAPRCDAIVAVSESVALDVRRVFGDRTPVSTVYNGIDLDRFQPTGPTLDLDQLAGLPPAPATSVRVGLVAVMAHWKGHDLFLDAMAALPRDLQVRGYVVGGPIYETEASQRSLDGLRARAQRLGLDDRVGFTGFVDVPEQAMRALDVVVHASIEPEPFGLVIAEAMACGRAVVASRAGGAAEIIDDGVDGVYFPPGDAKALAAAVIDLVRRPDRRRRLGAAGRRRAARFDRSLLADALVPVYIAAARRAGR